MPQKEGKAKLKETKELEVELSTHTSGSSKQRFLHECAALAGVNVGTPDLKCAIRTTFESSGAKHLVRFYEDIRNPKSNHYLGELYGLERGATVKRSLGSWTVHELSPDIESMEQRHIPSSRHCRIKIPAVVNPKVVRHWLEACCDCPNHLSVPDDSRTRLHDARSKGRLRAIYTASGQILPMPENAKYAALSYVWGKTHCRTGEIPQTVRDAVSLAASIGIEWLWVDRMCIRQDHGEKSSLIPLMKDIFALAELTIVSADGTGADCGLPGVSWKRTEEEPFKYRKWFEGATVLLAPCSFNTLFDGCIWRTRGWTFQEYIFSRRLLYLFNSEAIFSCATGMYRESTGMKLTSGGAGCSWGDGGALPPTIEGRLQVKMSSIEVPETSVIDVEEFTRAVSHYTARELTFEEDRIEAFAGIVTMSSDAKLGTALLLRGHPLNFFETALTWQQDEKSPLRRPSQDPDFAPSWSWASAGTEVWFLDSGHCRLFNYSMLEDMIVFGDMNEKYIPGFVRQAAGSRHDGLLAWSDRIFEGGSTSSPPCLPRLHLLTIVFEAQCRSDGQGMYTPEAEGTRLKSASFALDRQTSKKSRGWFRPQAGDLVGGLYAIVGSGKNLFIMLLARHPDEAGVFLRKALFPAGIGFMGEFVLHVKLRWDYIVIA